MTCQHCLASQTNPDYAGTSEPNGECIGCEVRETARMPRRKREQRYSQVLSKDGEAAMQAYRAEVVAEYRRIDALRGKA